MQRIRRQHMHRLNRRIRQQVLVVARRSFNPHRLPKRGRLGGVHARHARYIDKPQSPDLLRMYPAHKSGADNRC